jgi:hypothetical protein
VFLIKVVVGGEGGAPYITWYRNQSTVTRVLTYISYDKTISKSECILQYRKTECYCINWKGLDGSGRVHIVQKSNDRHPSTYLYFV